MQSKPESLQQIGALTGLRGVLCLWVWFLHVAMLLWMVGGRPFDDVVGAVTATIALHGYLAVDCFFILSGFVLCYRYQNTKLVCKVSFLKSFWRARFARIYPLYCVSLIGMGIGVWFFNLGAVLHGFPPESPELPAYDPVSTPSFFTNVFLVQSWSWFPRLTWNMAAWSISSEWAMYVLFPLMISCTRRLYSMQGAFVCVLCLQFVFLLVLGSSDVSAVYIGALYQNVNPEYVVMLDNAERTSRGAVELGIVRAFIGFMSGCLLFQIYQHKQFKQMPFFRLSIPCLGAVLCILLFFDVMYIYIWLFLLIMTLIDERSHLARILSHPVMLFLGNISYSVYLWHIPLLGCLLIWQDLGDFLGQCSSGLLLLLIVTFTLFLLGLSALSFWFIERPARDYLRGKPVPTAD